MAGELVPAGAAATAGGARNSAVPWLLLAPATLHLAEGYVQVVAKGPVAVKGLPEPVEIYTLTGASALRTRRSGRSAR